ncbi:MAG: amino acid ABC transporter substrate-binding protein [Lachnospiraceae bacterium]|nr:amino acid ABC transporter substrate-binding protein [Lachnospiraceae bacterium]
MKKIIALLCAATLVSVTLIGCGSKEAESTATATTEEAVTEETTTEAATTEATATEAAGTLADKTTFTVGFDANFPPYGYMDEDGEYVGFDLDLAQEVCDRIGWELVKQPIDWDSKDMELSSGSIDCIWNGFTYNGREDEYTWSDPYIDNSQVFVVAEDSGIASIADLSGKIVDVQADSAALTALEDEENADLAGSFGELIQVPEYNTAFMNLEAGAADAVAMDIGVANYQIASRGEGYVILDEPLTTEVYAIGFLLGNEELRDAVQEQLNAMAEDGTFAKIAEKWDLTDCIKIGK